MKNQYAVPMRELPPLVQEFAAYKSGIQNCSQKTVSEYLLDLRTFLRYVVASRDGIDLDGEDFLAIDISDLDLKFIGSIRTTEIYSFLQYTGSVRKNLWAAKARKLVSIRMFYRYLVTKTKQLDTNPAADIEGHDACRKICILGHFNFLKFFAIIILQARPPQRPLLMNNYFGGFHYEKHSEKSEKTLSKVPSGYERQVEHTDKNS